MMLTSKRIIIACLLFCQFTAIASNKEWIGIGSSEIKPAEVSLISSDVNSSVLRFTVHGFFKNIVITPKGNQCIITTGNSTPSMEKGCPDLPKLSSSIIIPDHGEMNLTVTDAEFIDFPFYDIATSSGF